MNLCTDRRSAIDRQGPHCRAAWDTNVLVTFKPMPVKGVARHVIAGAVRLTDNALLARQHPRRRRADATSSPGLGAVLHPTVDEMAIFAVQ